MGFLPEVRKRIDAAASRTERPALVVCEAPRELGPDSGPQIDDLPSLLLEVASEPPRLRQDGEIFSKEKPRFFALWHLSPLVRHDNQGYGGRSVGRRTPTRSR